MRIGIDYTAAVRQRAGIGRYTRSLVGALAVLDRENEYSLLAPSDGKLGTDFQLGHSNFQIKRTRLTERQMALVWQRARLALPVEWVTGPLDLFYSPDFVLPPTRARRKLLTVHDLSFVRVPECHYPGNLAYLNAAVPRAVARADLILADSNATRGDLQEIYHVPAERIRVVYSGAEAHFHPVTDAAELDRVRRAYGITRPFLFSVGTIEPRKNLVRLIEAFAQLPDSPEYELLIAGGLGWLYENILKTPERVGAGDRVRFLDYVPEGDLPALYSAAALFVYSSLYEGFGLPVLEALACGAAVITADDSSLPEVGGEAVRYVDPRDTAALSAAMSDLLQNGMRREELRRRGPRQAANFSWERAAGQLKAAFVDARAS